MKRLLKTVAVLGIGLTALMSVAESASADVPGDEAAFVQKLNELRASQGLGTLVVRDDLVALARLWSAQMAAAGTISHNPALTAQAPSDWTRLGENVGMGGGVQSLHDAFVASPAHYANMVNPYFTKLGVGVVWSGSTMYVAVEFMTGGTVTVVQPVSAASTITSRCRKTARGRTVCRKVRAKARRARRH